MKRIRMQAGSRAIDSAKKSDGNNIWPHIISVFLLLGLMPCDGDLIPPTIHNLSVSQGTNSRTSQMQIPTQAAVNYTGEFRTQLSSGSWTPFTNFAGNGFSQTVSNAAGTVAQRFYRVSVDPRPWIRGNPLSRDPYAGETVQLDVIATGLLPLSYQWYGPQGLLSDGGNVSGSTTANLVISNVDPGDEGNYWVAVTNFYGTTSCIPAGVRITLSQAPRILIDPQGQIITEKQNLSLNSSASGAATLSFKWFGPAGVLTDGTRVSGSTTMALNITDLQLADNGGYYMVASNSFGMATSAVAVVVVQAGVPPRITSDPLSQTVNAGQTVNLQIIANGTPNLVYRWNGPSGVLNNSGHISGTTTPSLTISNFQSSDNGDYFAVVTNSFGTATSISANVTAQ